MVRGVICGKKSKCFKLSLHTCTYTVVGRKNKLNFLVLVIAMYILMSNAFIFEERICREILYYKWWIFSPIILLILDIPYYQLFFSCCINTVINYIKKWMPRAIIAAQKVLRSKLGSLLALLLGRTLPIRFPPGVDGKSFRADIVYCMISEGHGTCTC